MTTDNVNVLEKVGRAALEWWNTSHSARAEHDHHCPLGRGVDVTSPGDPDVCTCGWANLKIALDEADA